MYDSEILHSPLCVSQGTTTVISIQIQMMYRMDSLSGLAVLVCNDFIFSS